MVIYLHLIPSFHYLCLLSDPDTNTFSVSRTVAGFGGCKSSTNWEAAMKLPQLINKENVHMRVCRLRVVEFMAVSLMKYTIRSHLQNHQEGTWARTRLSVDYTTTTNVECFTINNCPFHAYWEFRPASQAPAVCVINIWRPPVASLSLSGWRGTAGPHMLLGPVISQLGQKLKVGLRRSRGLASTS